MQTTIRVAAVTAAAISLGAATPPREVRISGSDYAFQVPEHIAAGETIFRFENRGTVRHELSIALIKEGFARDSVIASVVGGSPRRNWMDGQATIIVSRPADPPGPGIWLDLQRGRSYVLLCTLRDTPDAQPHVMLGMVAGFVAE